MSDAFKIFISSASDVKRERIIAIEVIERAHDSLNNTVGIRVDKYAWERDTAHTTNRPIQQRIDAELKDCNAFLLILDKRYGDIRPDGKSNLEHEIDIALKMLGRNNMKILLSYAKTMPCNNDAGVQEQRMNDLREDLMGRGVWLGFYEDEEDFRVLFTHDLYKTILEQYVSAPKRRALREFWDIGKPDEGGMKLAVVYPPVDRKFMQKQTPTDEIWLQRLVPYVVFEDFKAIQKIEQTLKLSGYNDKQFTFCSEQSVPSERYKMNRMWLCLPRNERAKNQLARYGDKVRFDFDKPNGVLQIKWREEGSKDWVNSITVDSPLCKYLKKQRKVDTDGDWTSAHGKVFAKDFAILARFSGLDDKLEDQRGLKDFFIAGIRGLGTWGAAKYLESKFEEIERLFRVEGDVQLLLEVTYEDERVIDVVNVSDKDQEYFRIQNDDVKIDTLIKGYNPLYKP